MSLRPSPSILISWVSQLQGPTTLRTGQIDPQGSAGNPGTTQFRGAGNALHEALEALRRVNGDVFLYCSSVSDETMEQMMRTAARRALGVVVVLHGLIHLLGAAKGLGWSSVPQLSEPIGTRLGAVWLATALLLVLAGVMVLRASRAWWLVAAVASVLSQVVILTSWNDAKAGTVVNVILMLAAGYGFAANGPSGLRAEYQRRLALVLAEPPGAGAVDETDLAALPAPVAGYLRHSGAIGAPHVVSFRARIHGRVRAGASRPWMSFTGEQANTFGASPSRLFLMDATMFGLPVDVLHVFVGASATMRVRLCSLLPMVDAAGPEMDRAETVTLFNDLCVLAPAALLGAPITWQTLDPNHVHATFTHGAHTVSAELHFNDAHELIDFVSDDRTRASTDGHQFTPQRWSTPLSRYRTIGALRVATYGEARWHAPEPEGEFSYLEYHLDEIVYNAGTRTAPASGGGHARGQW